MMRSLRYGLPEQELLAVLALIPPPALTQVLTMFARIAEKSGEDPFWDAAEQLP